MVCELIPPLRCDPAVNSSSICALKEERRSELEDFLIALDHSSRSDRFGYPAKDAVLIAHSARALHEACFTLGVFVNQKLAGVAETYRSEKTCDYEVFLVVAPLLRRCGLGWALLRSSLELARTEKAQTVRLLFPRHNWAMRTLAIRARAFLHLSLNELIAEIRLQPEAIRHATQQ